MKTYSIVVPVYNESKRIYNLKEIFEYTKKIPGKTEIIVVNDGSVDSTLEGLHKLQKKIDLKIVTYDKNMGKGYAIKMGMLEAKGDYCLFCDVDLSTPIAEIEKFIPHLDKYDLVIGTRKSKGAQVLTPQPFIRKWMGRGFTFLSQLMLNVWVSDFTCGFKFFSSKAAKKIFNNVHVFRWGFDSEVLYLAKKYNFSILEVPVVWVNDINTKVRFPRDLIISFRELVNVRYNDWVKKVYK